MINNRIKSKESRVKMRKWSIKRKWGKSKEYYSSVKIKETDEKFAWREHICSFWGKIYLEKVILKRNFFSFDFKILYMWIDFLKILKIALYWFCSWKMGGGSLRRRGLVRECFTILRGNWWRHLVLWWRRRWRHLRETGEVVLRQTAAAIRDKQLWN